MLLTLPKGDDNYTQRVSQGGLRCLCWSSVAQRISEILTMNLTNQIVTKNDHDSLFFKANDAHEMTASAIENQAAISDCCWWVVVVKGDILTTFCPDAEAMLKALVRVGAGDDFGAGAAYIHIPLVMHNVTGITLQPINYKTESRYLFLSELWIMLIKKN